MHFIMGLRFYNCRSLFESDPTIWSEWNAVLAPEDSLIPRLKVHDYWRAHVARNNIATAANGENDILMF
jgi:hypothetical protein